MAEFSIDTKRIYPMQGELDECYKKIREYAEKIEKVKNELDGKSYGDIKTTLGILYDSVIEEAASALSMEKALTQILNAYLETEEKICGIGKEKRKFYQEVLAFLHLGNENYRDPEYYSTTRIQEQAMNEYLKQECLGLLSEERYSESTWAKASVEERKEMLRQFLTELNSIFGINIENVNFEKLDSSSTRGFYSNSNKAITINTSYIEKKPEDSYMIMRTMIHEMRHAYQYAAIENPMDFVVTQATLDAWQHSFDTYKNSDDAGYDNYVSQSVEYDAKSFADQNNDIKGIDPDYGGTWGKGK